MSNPFDPGKSFVKGDGGFHPAEENLRHHKAQPSGAIPPEQDEADDPTPGLAAMSTEELRERARALVIEGHEKMSRGGLIEALRAYKDQLPQQTH